ncbi:hypothetical protein M0804_001354 [Polistes exclamans]|nr:hypothetical protein M0804_001354 [Polistes exclamans]
MSSLNYLDLCRLCLVKERVTVPIFEGEGDTRQIYLKITACLPVKVDREDKLPKKICNDCVYKVEFIYDFWNTSASSQKKFLEWLGEDGLEDKPNYATNVLNQNLMKSDPNGGNRLDGSMMQQVSEHQNNIGMGMMDNINLSIPMIMSSTNQQQITSVPMDTSVSSVQSVQEMPGTSTQSTHEQITQSQTNTSNQQEEEEESSEEEENSEDECDGDEGLPVKEENEEDPNNSRVIEPTTFVNVSLACDEAGPSGLQQQKVTEIPEMAMQQNAEGDPKSGDGGGGGGGETFGGLSGMLRQILSPSPSPETGEAGMTAIGCNFLQTNSIFSNQSSMMPLTLSSATLQTIPSHLSMIYPDQGGLLMDQSQLILPESYPCPTCGLEFRSTLKLNYHVKTSHPRRPEYEQQNVEITARYSCSVCPRSFFVLAHLRMHETTHELAPHSSSVLGAPTSNVPTSRGTNSTTGLMSGMSVVVPAGAATGNVEKTFGCDRCQASFRYRTLLERHRRMHELGQEKPYSCPRCLMRFETRNLYNHHAKTHKPSIDVNDRLAIDSNAVSLTDPNLTVTGTNPSIVSYPPSSTVAAANVNKSLTTVSYPCDSCSKQFTTIESLTSHKAVHRSRPLVCDVCGKGFTHRKYYVVHQRIHTGERPYLCAMCGKSFTQASTLTVHRRYHTGERPYTCTLCGKGFVTRTIMLNHMKKH